MINDENVFVMITPSTDIRVSNPTNGAFSQGYLPFNVSQYGNILVASPLAFRDDKKTAGFNNFSFPVGVRNVAYPHHETVVRVRIDIHQSGQTEN